MKKIGEYYGLYLKGNTLLLADVFENFRKTHLEIYEIDPAKFRSAPGLACSFRKDQRRIRINN